MPMSQAMRLCPHAAVVKPDFSKYTTASRAIRAIFERYSPEIEPLALDEAFIDATASLAIFGSGRAIGEAIRSAVRDELRLTCSVGIAPNKFVAKIASDLEKPDALVDMMLAPDALAARLAPLPVGRMWGVGPVTAQELTQRGYATFGDLQRAGEKQLALHFGDAGRSWWRLAQGRDDRVVESDRVAKSVGEEETFHEDLVSVREVEERLLEQADEVARRLRAKGLFAKTVSIKIRFSDFETHTHEKTLAIATDQTVELREAARTLLASFAAKRWRAVRLCGFSASRILEEAGQLPLFGDGKREKLSKLDDVRDRIREKFGG
jgi:DNA polymerase-4